MSKYRYGVLGVGITYVVMVVMNALANILPINNITTGAVSDSYFNLFAPVGLTFAIWGVIYLAMLGLILAMWFVKPEAQELPAWFQMQGLLIFGNVVNSVWILTWHYGVIWLSVLLMVALLISLIILHNMVLKMPLNRFYVMMRQVIDIYFGWITIAMIANVTTWLVAIDWQRWGISQDLWMVIMVIIGSVIASIVIIKDRSFSYGLVITWALFGIITKHLSPQYFAQSYPSVVLVTLIALVVIMMETLIYGPGVIRAFREETFTRNH